MLRVWWEEPVAFNLVSELEMLNLFHGNIIPVYQGEVNKISIFKEYGMRLNKSEEEDYYERTNGELYVE